MGLIPIGYGNYVSSGRILAAVVPDSAPVRRAVSEGRRQSRVVDATAGHRTRTVLFMDTGQLVLSALSTETLANRVRRHGSLAGPVEPGPEEVDEE